MGRLSKWLMLLLPALLAWAVYAPAAGYGFVNYDDNRYFTENPHVLGGLTWENVRWAFGIHGPSMWIPLTWLSHQAMVSEFGTDAGPQHVLNLVLHAANAVLLGNWLRRSTGRAGLSLGVALVFAAHPLHAESVAWITERKDVLAVLFCLLALHFHERRTRGGGFASYAGMLVCHALAVMAKPLAVTLPCAMLLWEIWPLSGRILLRSAAEKLPLLALSAVASWLTVLCQQSIGAIGSGAEYPVGGRMANALVAYVTYLRRLFVPDDLAVFYPYPNRIPAVEWMGALILLGAVAFAAWRLRKEVTAVLVGWLWFLGTLVPMIGFVQAGGAAMADRYAYFPFIGLYVAVAWFLDAVAKRHPELGPAIAGTAGAGVIAFAVAGRKQVGVWENSITLMRHAVEVTERNHLAHNNLGLALEETGNREAARHHYVTALAARPDYSEALNNLGVLEARESRIVPALDHLEAAVRSEPSHAVAWHNLGKVRLQGGNVDGAREAFRTSIRLAPEFPPPRYDLALLEIGLGRMEEARKLLEELVRLAPAYADAWTNLGFVEDKLGDEEKARRAYRRASELGSPTAARNLEILDHGE